MDIGTHIVIVWYAMSDIAMLPPLCDAHAELCFKCGRPGHMVRNCPTLTASSWELGYGHCIRCASASCPCANKADYFRWGLLGGG